MRNAHPGSKIQLADLEGCCSRVVQHATASNTVFYCQHFFLCSKTGEPIDHIVYKNRKYKRCSAATNR